MSHTYHTCMLIFFIFLSSGFISVSARDQKEWSGFKEIRIEQSNEQLCEGPLGVNCPRDGKLFGDLVWHPFGDDTPPPRSSEDSEVISAEVEGIEYNGDAHPLES